MAAVLVDDSDVLVDDPGFGFDGYTFLVDTSERYFDDPGILVDDAYFTMDGDRVPGPGTVASTVVLVNRRLGQSGNPYVALDYAVGGTITVAMFIDKFLAGNVSNVSASVSDLGGEQAVTKPATLHGSAASVQIAPGELVGAGPHLVRFSATVHGTPLTFPSDRYIQVYDTSGA